MSWEESWRGVRIRCGDRVSSPAERDRFVPEAATSSWLDQVHSASILRARPGSAGEGDGLVTDVSDLALVLVTADCVPVLLATEERLGAAHAGWRGIEKGVVGELARRLQATGAGACRAWIGPHIGACCYEVSEEVANRVCAASSPQVRSSAAPSRPHLDLGLAVEIQLRRAGIRNVRCLGPCTRCDPRLWSYRRDGSAAGRNFSAIWRAPGT